MRFLLYFLTVLCLCGCEWSSTYKPSEKQKITNEIRKRAAIKISKETGLIPCGTGGQMMNQIKMLNLGFDCREPIDVNRARELLVAAVQVFTDEINGDVRIRPYLDKFPFKNVEIDIFVQDRNGRGFAEGTLRVASASKGILIYLAHDENKRYKTLYQETYEEAQQKVHDSLAEEQAVSS